MATINGDKLHVRECLLDSEGKTVTFYSAGNIIMLGDTMTFKK